MSLIKYSNRKIYDRMKSKYISFRELELDIKNFRDIKVLEHFTDKDITKETLLSLIGSKVDTKLTLEEIVEIVRRL